MDITYIDFFYYLFIYLL